MDAVILAFAFVSFLSLVACWLVLPHSTAVVHSAQAAQCQCQRCLADRTVAADLQHPATSERGTRILEIEPA